MSSSALLTVLLLVMTPAVTAQDASTTNPLNVFISIAQSLGSEFPPSSTVPSTLATSTSPAPTSTSTTPTSSAAPTSSTLLSSSTPTAAAVQSTANGLSNTARTAIIIVCSIVGALLLALLALLIVCCIRRSRKKGERGSPIDKEETETKEIGTSLRADDWYHGNNSHHGYIGGPEPTATVSQTEMGQRQRQSQEKNSRQSMSVSPVEDSGEPPDLADHPAFARDALDRSADPYKAAGVGAMAGAAAAAGRKSGDSTRRSGAEAQRRSMGERRFSDHMPARKPVGSPAVAPNYKRTSNPLRIDAAEGALGAGAFGAGAVSEHRRGHARDSGGYEGAYDPFTSPPSQHPEPNVTSPLSSHPSNPLLAGGRSRKRDSYRSQTSFEDGNDSAEIPTAKLKHKRRLTPLGFDFGLPQPDTEADHEMAHEHEYEPLASDFEPQTLTAPMSRFHKADSSVAGDTHSNMPIATHRDALEHQNQLAHHNPSTAPLVPPRSPHRLSRSSFDDDPAIPPRSPKRTSWHASRENLPNTNPAPTNPARSSDIFRDSGDFAYSSPPYSPYSPYSTASGSPHQHSSPRLGPALGHRRGSSVQYQQWSSSSLPLRTAYAVDAAPQGQSGSGSPYVGVPSGSRGALGQERAPGSGYGSGHPVYSGRNDSGAASSVESWVSARAVPVAGSVPTPWEDNAIRRNSSSGQLRRPKSLLGQGQGAEKGHEKQHRRRSGENGSADMGMGRERHPDSGQFMGSAGRSGSASRHSSWNGYEGPGEFDASWGEGNVEEPVFEKHGMRRDGREGRRRSSGGSTGFDPRYGRWTDHTFDENFGLGAGEAL